jgi:hypothetical protein
LITSTLFIFNPAPCEHEQIEDWPRIYQTGKINGLLESIKSLWTRLLIALRQAQCERYTCKINGIPVHAELVEA